MTTLLTASTTDEPLVKGSVVAKIDATPVTHSTQTVLLERRTIDATYKPEIRVRLVPTPVKHRDLDTSG